MKQSNEKDQDLLEQYLSAIPRDRAIVVGRHGSFTADQLREEIRKNTTVGEEIKDAVRRHKSYRQRMKLKK